MSADLPAAVRAVVERIEVAPAVPDSDPATGAIGRLAAWWEAVGPDAAPPTPADLEAPPAVRALDAAEPHDRPAREGDAAAAMLAGIAAADRAIDAGATLLVVAIPALGPAQDADRAVIAVLTRREASAVLPQPPGMTDREWMARCERVRDLAAAAHAGRGDPLALLAATDAADAAVAAGALLAAAARRTPVLLDGTTAMAAAVLADRLGYRARGWWLVASDSPDPGRSAVVDRVDLRVGLPLGVSDDTGLGARAVLALLRLSG